MNLSQPRRFLNTGLLFLEVDPKKDEPVVEVIESNPVGLSDGVPPVTDGTSESEPDIAYLDAAKEVEPRAAELEVAPKPIETVTVVLSAALCVSIHD